MENKDYLDCLTKLHSLLNELNKGDSPYEKYYTLRKINGENCKYLPQLAKQIVISEEIKELLVWVNGPHGT